MSAFHHDDETAATARPEHLAATVSEHGIVLRRDALAIGVTRHEIATMLDTGYLIREARSVYRLAGATRTGPTAARAAVSAAGGYGLGLISAMAWAGVRLRWLPDDPRHVHVLIDAGSRIKSKDWYSVHPTRRLDIETETAVVNGVRITTVPRSIRDFAAVLPYSEESTRQLDAWVDEARAVDMLEIEHLAAVADRERSNKVKKRLTDLHDRHVGIAPELFKSVGEAWLKDLIVRNGLPSPLWNVKPPFATKEVDAYYPHVPLIIEFDGYWVHRPRGKHHRDRRGDRRALAGHRVPTVRITKWDFENDLVQLERDIVSLVSGPALMLPLAA